MDTNIQFTINSFRQLFPDKIFSPENSLILSKIPEISLTAVKFPDISRFSRFSDKWTPWTMEFDILKIV